MQLISITTDAQGASVVSARELHGLLEVKSKFADWFKNRADKYGLIDGEDFVTLSKNLENGGRELDYALTLDCAKELSMVQNNAKGKEARQYFIAVEKQLRTVATLPAPTTEQVLLQQAHTLVDQQSQINQLRADIGQLQAGVRPVRQQRILPALLQVRNSDLRQQINGRANQYANQCNVSQREVYSYLYKRLQSVYGMNPYQLTRRPGESLIDAIERYGYLDRLFSLIVSELVIPDETDPF